MNRPTLGLEPGAALLGGVSGTLVRDLPWLDGWLAGVPALRTAAASTLSLDGEFALSLPNPNTRGDVFLDDFDASDARPLSLLSYEWLRGSAPADRVGADDVLPAQVDAGTVSELVWNDEVAEIYLGPTLTARMRARVPEPELAGAVEAAGSGLPSAPEGESSGWQGPPPAMPPQPEEDR